MRRLDPPAFLALPLALAIGCARAAAVPAPKGDAVAQRADLAAFETGFFDVDRSYGREARAEAKRRLDELKASSGAVSDTRFILALSQIAALADNGHTGIFYRGSAPELGRVGLRLAPFGEDFVVVQADAEHAFLSGGRLVSIDGHPLPELVAAARTLTGGLPTRRDRMAGIFLESPGQLHALDLAREAGQATYVFEMRNGERREARLGVTSPPGSGFDASMAVLSPEDAPSGWGTLLPREKEPWALEEIGETQRRRDLPEADAILIQLRSNLDGPRPLAAFLDEAEAARRKARRRNVILDMRMNGGGNLQLTQEWMSRLPGRLPTGGRVVVLISPWTFSAAISSVGYLKQAGGERVILVGEPPGDRLNFFAEGRPIQLPNSGARVFMATQRHDYLNGCRAYTDCHPYVAEHPIAVKSLDPEVAAPWTLDAYIAGRDPGLEAALKVLQGSARR
ncbi:MAG: hypothetical protein ABI565_10265 [Vicinamibacteria bacterium]